MAKYKIIPIDIYKRDITVFIGSHEEFKDWVSSYRLPSSWEQLVESIVESDNNAIASFWRNRINGNGIIELPWHPRDVEELGIAAHESLHCVMHILSFVGIPCVPNEANEPYTYLLEYIFTNILNFNDYKLINT